MATSFERDGVHWHRRDDGSWLRFNAETAQWESAARPDWAPSGPPPPPPPTPLGPTPAGGAPPAAARPSYPFRSRLTAGANLKVLLGLGVLLAVVAVVVDFDALRLIDDLRRGREISSAEFTYAATRGNWVGGISGLLFLVTLILFISWLYVAYKNLIPLGAPKLGRRAGWAIGGWFLPVANLVMPKLIVDEIYRQSDPDNPLNVHPDARMGRVSPVVHWWWATFWLSVLLNIIATAMLGVAVQEAVSEPVALTDEAFQAASVFLASDVLSVVAGVLCFMVVHKISHRQEQRALRLGVVGGPPRVASAPSP